MVGVILSLILQVVGFYFGYQFYLPTLELVSKGGLHVLGAFFTTGAFLFFIMLTTSIITLKLLITSILKIKTYWWLLIIQLLSVAVHVYVVFDFLSVLNKI